jgi:BON domain
MRWPVTLIHEFQKRWTGVISMNRDDDVDDLMEDDDYTPEREISAATDDTSIVPGGEDGAELPDDLDDDDDVGQTTRGPITDDELTARVRRLLRIDAATSMLRIHVSTEDGVVTLRGMVQTLDDTDNAAEVASRVDGVLDVLDELEVE